MATTILLISNGQSIWNVAERFRPQTDAPLNDAGIQQAEATGRRIAAKWQPNAVYSSPLARAVRTADAIAENFNLPVVVHPGLADIDYGEWQGVTADQALKRWPEMVEAWYDAPHLVRIPGGETLDALRKRAMETVKHMASCHAGQVIVLVGHPIINRIILLGVLGLGNERFWHIRQDTCGINVIKAEAKDYTLISLNDTCHLSRLGPA
jgi:broad specificity phosphatase PhoE